MARPRKITNEQILEAARVAIAREGVGVSTAVIARDAGISEGTIFRRYPTKEALFREALCTAGKLTVDFESRVGKGHVREQLMGVVLDLLDRMRHKLPPLIALANSLGVHPHELWRERPDHAPVEGIKALARYIDAEMRLGRLAPAHPEVVARVLAGSVHNYLFLEYLGAEDGSSIAAPSFARGLVDLLWRGLAVPDVDVMVEN